MAEFGAPIMTTVGPQFGAPIVRLVGAGIAGTVVSGIVGDGVTNDTLALQTAIDAADTGDVLLLPADSQIAVTTLTLNKSVTLAGAGVWSTFLVPLSATADCLAVNVNQTTPINVELRDFTIAPKTGTSPVITAGALLRLGNVAKSIVQNVGLNNALGGAPYIGLKVDNAQATTFLGYVYGCSNDGILLTPNATALTGINGFSILAGSRSDDNGRYGMEFLNASTTYALDGVYVGQVSIHSNDAGGVYLAAATNCIIRNVAFTDTLIDSNTGHGFEVGVSHPIYNLKCTNVWNYGNSADGYRLGTGAVGMKIVGGRIATNANQGIFLLYCHEIQIDNVDLVSNAQSGSGEYAILTYDTTGQIQINDCKIWNRADYVNKQNGISIAANTEDVLINGGSAICGSTTVPALLDLGTRTRVQNFLAGEDEATATLYNYQQTIQLTPVGNILTGTDDLMTYTLGYNSLARVGSGIRVTGWGVTANTVNTKTLTLQFGVTTLVTRALTVSQASNWRVVAELFKTSTDNQTFTAQLTQSGATTITDVFAGNATIDDQPPIIVKFTGTATTTNDIVQRGMLVEFF